MSPSIYLPREAIIVDIIDLTPSEKLFRLQLAEAIPLNHTPGQFVQVSIPGFEEAPISVASSPTRGALFELGVRKAGSLTSVMHKLKAGDSIGIRGPFGHGFELSELMGKNLILISGGCGLAPMRSLIQYCEDFSDDFGSVTILYGAKNPDSILFKDEVKQWGTSEHFTCSYTVDTATGDACYGGNVGLITKLISPLSFVPENSIAVIIGPPVMYRPVIEKLKQKGLDSSQIILSLERQMRCGVGKCGHCAIDHLYCCKDGPVFMLDMIENIPGAIP